MRQKEENGSDNKKSSGTQEVDLSAFSAEIEHRKSFALPYEQKLGHLTATQPKLGLTPLLIELVYIRFR